MALTLDLMPTGRADAHPRRLLRRRELRRRLPEREHHVHNTLRGALRDVLEGAPERVLLIWQFARE